MRSRLPAEGVFGRFQYPTPPLGRPGGTQAFFHHEWKKEEAKEKLKRTVEAYRQFEQGQMPAGREPTRCGFLPRRRAGTGRPRAGPGEGGHRPADRAAAEEEG